MISFFSCLNVLWLIHTYLFIYLFIYLFVCLTWTSQLHWTNHMHLLKCFSTHANIKCIIHILIYISIYIYICTHLRCFISSLSLPLISGVLSLLYLFHSSRVFYLFFISSTHLGCFISSLSLPLISGVLSFSPVFSTHSALLSWQGRQLQTRVLLWWVLNHKQRLLFWLQSDMHSE